MRREKARLCCRAGILSLLLVDAAQASCIFLPGKTADITIDAIVTPLFDAAGKPAPGCLVRSKGAIIGQALSEDICTLAAGAKVRARLTPGCCDTGLPPGGVCVIITREKPLPQ